MSMLYNDLLLRQAREKAVLIMRAFESCSWRLRPTARRLGMDATRLRRLLARAPTNSVLGALFKMYQEEQKKRTSR